MDIRINDLTLPPLDYSPGRSRPSGINRHPNSVGTESIGQSKQIKAHEGFSSPRSVLNNRELTALEALFGKGDGGEGITYGTRNHVSIYKGHFLDLKG